MCSHDSAHVGDRGQHVRVCSFLPWWDWTQAIRLGSRLLTNWTTSLAQELAVCSYQKQRIIHKLIFFFNVCVCFVCMYACVSLPLACLMSERPEKGIRSPEARVTGTWWSFGVSPGSGAQVLCKSSISMGHLSNSVKFCTSRRKHKIASYFPEFLLSHPPIGFLSHTEALFFFF